MITLSLILSSATRPPPGPFPSHPTSPCNLLLKMQHDDLIWRNVNNNFCSYKTKTIKQTFCRNKYNITGLCSRMACPLANSRYATIIEHDGKLVLYVKTVERAHSPRALWEKIKLSTDYRKALAAIDTHLQYWPEYYIHKAKQRLTKMTQYLLRKKRLMLRTKTRLVGVKKKVERREAKREKKAVVAAKVESAIEKELLDRLRTGAYGDIYNYPQEQYENALDTAMNAQDMEDEEEMEEEEELTGDEYEAQYEDEDESEDESLEDIEDSKRAVQNGNDFDFDDSSDDEDDDNEGDDDSDESPGEPEGDALSKLRARAKRRAAARKSGGRGGKGKKGKRVKRRAEMEMEYEREDTTQRVAQLEEE